VLKIVKKLSQRKPKLYPIAGKWRLGAGRGQLQHFRQVRQRRKKRLPGGLKLEKGESVAFPFFGVQA
jgi:hypothetical protein